MYLNYYAAEVNDPDDNPPIGIILCTDKDSIAAEYALGGLSNNIFASRYVLYMPDKEQLIAQVEAVLKTGMKRKTTAMNEKELIGKVHSTVYHQCQRRGYAAPVDVLMEVGVLQKQKYEDWRFGRVDYLERVCTVNLRKLSFIMRQMQVCAQKSGLKSSFCYYKQWGVKKKNGQGHKPVVPLRFSKSGNPEIENGMQLILWTPNGLQF